MEIQSFPNSANAALTRKLKVVCNLSIAALVFACIIIIVGILGLFIPYVAIFAVGMLFMFNSFWIGALMLVTGILGICGYKRGIYHHCPATAHLVFSIISALAVAAGLAASIYVLAMMTTVIVEKFQNGHTLSQVATGVTIAAYSGAAFTALVYVFFFYCCLHGSIIYCKVPRNILIHNVNLSSIPGVVEPTPVPAPAINYANNYPPNYSYTPDYKIPASTGGSQIQQV